MPATNVTVPQELAVTRRADGSVDLDVVSRNPIEALTVLDALAQEVEDLRMQRMILLIVGSVLLFSLLGMLAYHLAQQKKMRARLAQLGGGSGLATRG